MTLKLMPNTKYTLSETLIPLSPRERGTLIFSYIRRLGQCFGCSRLRISLLLLVLRKKTGGMKMLLHMFRVITKTGLVLGVLSMHFMFL